MNHTVIISLPQWVIVYFVFAFSVNVAMTFLIYASLKNAAKKSKRQEQYPKDQVKLNTTKE